ncbi:MAG: adenosylmethionine--8-amino-7-oxononanoate transaminase [Planctomycetota bacterium]|jgi:adenosylmethionine-8-amino-7-oxononanoate aminotransferase
MTSDGTKRTDEPVTGRADASVGVSEQLRQKHLWMPYSQMKTALPAVEIVSTLGVFLQTADGRRLIDAISCWWTACHGHRHPHLVSAVADQLKTMPHVMLGGIQHPQAKRLAARLAQLLPGDLNHVFFSDSGSVAVEVALKIAKQYWLNQGESGRNHFVCFQHAYHGDTTGAMSVCDPVDSMHAHFKGFLLKQFPRPIPQTEQEFAEFSQFLRHHRHELAGVIIEPLVQGAAGMKFHSAGQLRELAERVRAERLLLIADEIATGFGRTGTMFACDQAEIVPDLICLGKGLTGGMLPLAATVATTEVFNQFYSDEPDHALMHGPTYMGNALACAAANASIDLFEKEPRLEQARRIAEWGEERLGRLRSHPRVRQLRCLGALVVVEIDCEPGLKPVVPRYIEKGVWARPLRNTLYLAPPFVISWPQLEQCADALQWVLDNLP